MARIFISYSRVDRRFVEALADKLRRIYGHDNVWFDEGLHGGDIWWEEILEQIKDRDIFIYVLSDDSVQSDYCQAEFTEARRLQKQIITVQARDRTRLTDALGDIHYINMANGVDDADALTDLYRSVNKRITKVPKRSPKPLWEAATPRPGKVDEKSRPIDGPDVDTPTLEIPLAERENMRVNNKPWWKKQEFVIGAILVPIIAAVLGAVIQNMGNNNSPQSPITAIVTQISTDDPEPTQDINADDARATGAAQAFATLTALAPTDRPTISPVPTDTPISSSDIQQTAQAEIFATETVVAQTQVVIAQETQNAVLTEQFSAGATATYIAQLSLTPAPTYTITPTITSHPTDTPNPLQAAFTPVARNSDWTPIERDFDGVTMVLVPAGCFMMGNDPNGQYWDGRRWIIGVADGGRQCFERPFWIDKYEVSNSEYGSTGCSERSSESSQPRNCINWYRAQEYCVSRGGRLPTESEWEYAARGPDNLIYPWPGEFTTQNVAHSQNSNSQTVQVGTYMDGVSWVGAFDLSGNVWEWVLSEYTDYPYVADDGREETTSNVLRTLRGGSFRSASSNLRSANRHGLLPSNEIDDLGFRCIRSFG